MSIVDDDDDLPREASGLRLELRYGSHHRARLARAELAREFSDDTFTCPHCHSKLRGDLCCAPTERPLCPCQGSPSDCPDFTAEELRKEAR